MADIRRKKVRELLDKLTPVLQDEVCSSSILEALCLIIGQLVGNAPVEIRPILRDTICDRIADAEYSTHKENSKKHTIN